MTPDQIITACSEAKTLLGPTVDILSVGSVTCDDEMVRLHLRHFDDLERLGKDPRPTVFDGREHHRVRIGCCEFFAVGPRVQEAVSP